MEPLSGKPIQNIIRHWWLVLFAGVLLIGLGVWVVSSPFQSYLSLSLLFAACVVAAGLFELTFSIVNHKIMNGWGWMLAGGMIDVFVGGYLFYYPLITMIILPLIVGFWLLFRGIMAIGNALDVRSYGFGDWRWLLFTGVTIILLALLILVNPDFGIFNIIVWTGLAFIFAGIFRIYLSLKLRKLKDAL